MVVALGLAAAIGPNSRVKRPDQLVLHIGPNPDVHQSGEGRPQRGRMTKQSRSHARRLAVIVWHMLTKSEDHVWVRPALHAKKLRGLGLRFGQLARRANADRPTNIL